MRSWWLSFLKRRERALPAGNKVPPRNAATVGSGQLGGDTDPHGQACQRGWARDQAIGARLGAVNGPRTGRGRDGDSGSQGFAGSQQRPTAWRDGFMATLVADPGLLPGLCRAGNDRDAS